MLLYTDSPRRSIHKSNVISLAVRETRSEWHRLLAWQSRKFEIRSYRDGRTRYRGFARKATEHRAKLLERIVLEACVGGQIGENNMLRSDKMQIRRHPGMERECGATWTVFGDDKRKRKRTQVEQR